MCVMYVGLPLASFVPVGWKVIGSCPPKASL